MGQITVARVSVTVSQRRPPIKLNDMTCTTVLPADMRLRADTCHCTREYLSLPMNCIFNIFGDLNCKKKRDTIPTIGERNTLSTRQNNFALNCADSRLFTNFCSQDPWRYYCNNLGHLSINQGPNPEHKAQCDGKLKILYSRLIYAIIYT
jgi:hypothetical protein